MTEKTKRRKVIAAARRYWAQHDSRVRVCADVHAVRMMTGLHHATVRRILLDIYAKGIV